MGTGACPSVHYPCSYSGSQPIGEPEGCLLGTISVMSRRITSRRPMKRQNWIVAVLSEPEQSTVRPEQALFGGTDSVFSQLVGQSAAGKSHATGGLGLRAASGI